MDLICTNMVATTLLFTWQIYLGLALISQLNFQKHDLASYVCGLFSGQDLAQWNTLPQMKQGPLFLPGGPPPVAPPGPPCPPLLSSLLCSTFFASPSLAISSNPAVRPFWAKSTISFTWFKWYCNQTSRSRASLSWIPASIATTFIVVNERTSSPQSCRHLEGFGPMVVLSFASSRADSLWMSWGDQYNHDFDLFSVIRVHLLVFPGHAGSHSSPQALGVCRVSSLSLKDLRVLGL